MVNNYSPNKSKKKEKKIVSTKTKNYTKIESNLPVDQQPVNWTTFESQTRRNFQISLPTTVRTTFEIT